MQIELKNIKVSTFMSQETHCFEASLYIDGKRIGKVWNEGHGGPDGFTGDELAYSQANEWVKDNHAGQTINGLHIPTDLEDVCAQRLADHLMAKDLRRSMKSRVLFYRPEEKQIMELRWKGVRKIDERHIEVAQRDNPSAVILNTLPFDEAFAAYQQYAAVA